MFQNLFQVTRLIGAVVRVGESSILTDNSVCGIVTESLAQPRGWLVMTCEPPLQGRFISVDIDHEESESPVALKICEVFVTESFSTECPNVQGRLLISTYVTLFCLRSSPAPCFNQSRWDGQTYQALSLV